MRKGKKNERGIVANLRQEIIEVGSEFDGLGLFSEKSRKKAKIALAIAKELETKKEGFIWLEKEKTRKLVHPNNVAKNLKDGWKKVKYVESKKRK